MIGLFVMTEVQMLPEYNRMQRRKVRIVIVGYSYRGFSQIYYTVCRIVVFKELDHFQIVMNQRTAFGCYTGIEQGAGEKCIGQNAVGSSEELIAGLVRFSHLEQRHCKNEFTGRAVPLAPGTQQTDVFLD